MPAFNVPYLPMVEPVIRAVVDQDAFAFVEVARLEWIKFQSRSLKAVYDEFQRWADPDHVRLHLDHVPAIDEDGRVVDFIPIFREAIRWGYQSIMIDGSRLPLAENMETTGLAVELAHEAGIPCEAELGAVLGHEEGPLPPYEEIFRSGRGFTDAGEAERFVRETSCDWLSVAIGNIHGAVSEAFRDKEKVQAKLDLEHLKALHEAARIPLVLHGGSGIGKEYLLQAIRLGISKINIGTEIRQAYESALRKTGSEADARRAVYEKTVFLLRDFLGLSGTRERLL